MLCRNHSWDVPGPGVPQIAIFTNRGFLTQVRDKPGLDPRLGQVSETEIRVSETEIRVSPLAPHVARPFSGLGRLSAATRHAARSVCLAARPYAHGLVTRRAPIDSKLGQLS